MGSDCVSGECLADGRCAPTDGGSGGSTSGSSTSGGGGSTGGSGGSSSGGSSGGLPTDGGAGGSDGGLAGDGGAGGFDAGGGPACDFTFDGTISRAQVPVGPGLQATFEVAEDAGFDTTGQPLGDGGFLWSLAGPFPSDHAVPVQTLPLAGEWFSAQYPSASYAVTLSDLSPDLGVFAANASAIELVGLASPSQGSGETEVGYSPAVPVLSFPLAIGGAWQTNSTVSGTFEGFPNTTYLESYSSTVDKIGSLIIPSGTSFPVLRVRTDLVRTFGALVTTQRSYAFVTPCFGTVATVVSQLDEPAVEFQNAAELRRLAEP